MQLLALATALAVIAFALNGLYQVIRKPSELLFPVSGTLNKTPPATWRDYAPLFQKYSTATLTPPLLAAIAQIEAAGNPVARTYWRWSWSTHPFSLYRPASSSVGMYQMTDGTFAEARHYCIRDHQLAVERSWQGDGSGQNPSCWLNSLYTRVVPSHAVELAAADLERGVATALERHPAPHATLAQKQALAAVIHLCGAGGGDAFARRAFRLTPGQRCGDHDVGDYLARVNGMRAEFERLAAHASSPTV